MSDQARAILCPYCGDVQSSQDRCQNCGGFFDALSRRVTQQHMGPWFIRDREAPFRPGCSFAVLLKQIQRGKITRDTILRGPTTKQFWAQARHVPGVAHHLGYCHACDAKVAAAEGRCAACGAAFVEVTERDQLGLDPMDANVARETSAAPSPGPRKSVRREAASPAGGGSVARARVVATTALGPMAEASASAPPAGRNTVEWLTGDSGGATDAPAARADDRFAAAMALPQPAPPPEDGALAAEGHGVGAAAGGVSPIVWALVGVNVLLIVAVVGFMLFKDMFTAAEPVRNEAPAVTEPAPQRPAEPGKEAPVTPAPPAESANASWPVSKAPSVAAGAQPPPAAAAPAPTTPGSPKPPPVGILGGERSPVSSVRMPIPVPITRSQAAAPASKGENAAPSAANFFGISTGEASGVSPEQLEALNKTMREVDALHRGGMLAEALAKLKQLKQNLPSAIRSEGLDSTISRVEKELAEKETREFFAK